MTYTIYSLDTQELLREVSDLTYTSVAYLTSISIITPSRAEQILGYPLITQVSQNNI
jgi:hypothetical protein